VLGDQLTSGLGQSFDDFEGPAADPRGFSAHTKFPPGQVDL
jgi:hypothetical protein